MNNKRINPKLLAWTLTSNLLAWLLLILNIDWIMAASSLWLTPPVVLMAVTLTRVIDIYFIPNYDFWRQIRENNVAAGLVFLGLCILVVGAVHALLG